MEIKSWTTPQLTVFGSVEELTGGGLCDKQLGFSDTFIQIPIIDIPIQ